MSVLTPWVARSAFLGWALLVTAGTHWPQVRIEGPVPRTDLWIHLAAFGTWGFLAVWAGWFGAASSGKNFRMSALLTVVVAIADEATQAIPGLYRTVALSDAAMNVAGGLLGVGLGSLAARRFARAEQP